MLADDIEHYKPVMPANAVCETDQSNLNTNVEITNSSSTDKKTTEKTHNTNSVLQCPKGASSRNLELSLPKSTEDNQCDEQFTLDTQTEKSSESQPSLLDGGTPSILSQAFHDVMHSAPASTNESLSYTNLSLCQQLLCSDN